MSEHLPFFIPTRDRKVCLEGLLFQLNRFGQPPDRIHLIDNASTYEPLLKLLSFLETKGYHVHRFKENHGGRGSFALVHSGPLQKFVGDGAFFFSDPDVVPVVESPKKTLQHMHATLAMHPNLAKIGLSLRVNDIPAHFPFRKEIQDWEGRFWKKSLNKEMFAADVATTFCIVRSRKSVNRLAYSSGKDARLKPPYEARHLSWYLDPKAMPEDEHHYYENTQNRRGGDPGAGTSFNLLRLEEAWRA